MANKIECKFNPGGPICIKKREEIGLPPLTILTLAGTTTRDGILRVCNNCRVFSSARLQDSDDKKPMFPAPSSI